MCVPVKERERHRERERERERQREREQLRTKIIYKCWEKISWRNP